MAYNLENKKEVGKKLQNFIKKTADIDNEGGAYRVNGVTSHRYRSWEYCRKAFINARGKELDADTKDSLALNLAFYLASWGMYRGSSFLLNLDYTVHKEIVEKVMDPYYDHLFDSDSLIKEDSNTYLDLLFGNRGIKTEISGIYANWHRAVKKDMSEDAEENSGASNGDSISDVLITKVLMGVYGCIPAYDRFFTDGLKKQKINAQFNRNGVSALLEYINNNENFRSCLESKEFDIEVERKNRFKDSVNIYTFMKIVDMLFWEIGNGCSVVVTKPSKTAAKPKLKGEDIEELEQQIIKDTFEKNINMYSFEYKDIKFESENIGSLIMCIYDYFGISKNNCRMQEVKKKIEEENGLEWNWQATTKYSKKLKYSN